MEAQDWREADDRAEGSPAILLKGRMKVLDMRDAGKKSA